VPIASLPGTPDLLPLHAADPGRYPFLLQTLGSRGWDILFAFPQQILLSSGSETGLFPLLGDCWKGSREAPTDAPASLPFRGGWFIYLGYELLHEIEPAVPVRYPAFPFPLYCLARVPAGILVNRRSRQTYLFAEPEYGHYLKPLRDDLGRMGEFVPRPVSVERVTEEKEEMFLQGVRQVKRYIREGDVFQVNLSRRWDAALASGGAVDLYARVRQTNPAPFAGIADFGRYQIVSSSPERLLKVENGEIETRPIAGTHPRSPHLEEDRRLREALLESPKERAEHIMLIDLERNDLGRVCAPGSVKVRELMAVESYAHVHHIESCVRGQLRDGITPPEVIRALFPGGTITGCPKVRTMQIIGELEMTPRLAYTGSMGYLNRDGSMDLNILIRSMMVGEDGLSFRAGAGIVADSDPLRELEETRAKAKGMLRALDAR
jgi:anthranilate synthase component 1